MKDFESCVRYYALKFISYSIGVLICGIALILLYLNGTCTITLSIPKNTSTYSIIGSVCVLIYSTYSLIYLLICTPKNIANKYVGSVGCIGAEEYYKAFILLLICIRENNTQFPVKVSSDMKEYLLRCYADTLRNEFGFGTNKPRIDSYYVEVSDIQADRIDIRFSIGGTSFGVNTKTLPLNERTAITKWTMLHIDESYAHAQFNL